ncbi:diguanylate cyclase domain-containing protein [Thiomicrorhabdus aquaedulcis]|uniref:diguanylate cyclase domain-containing protein n=1 Tax=Thiomicrorhabdus aquaedulcis TaxID=2211106 RepID=UPI000FDBE2CD|nr:diguanylate cyclase [Thiomicrorhabdus aquaedulcis]
MSLAFDELLDFGAIKLKMMGSMAGVGTFVYDYTDQTLELDTAMIQNFGVFSQRLTHDIDDWQSVITETISLKLAIETCLQENTFELAFSQQHPIKGVRYYKTFGEVFYANERAFLVGCCWDVTNEKLSNDFALQMIDTDLITGLPNRTVLLKTLNQRAKNAKPGCLHGLVCFDMDGFKSVNDIFGHSIGDSLLRAIALRLHSNISDSELLFALGSDEFVLFVPNVANRHALTEKVAHLQQQLAQPIIVNGQTFKTSACYGLDVCNHLDVLAGGWEDSSETFIKRANVAMHNAKRYKRGSWSFYEDTLLESTTEKFIIGQGLFSALELGQLEVYYQPQFFIDAGCKKISGIEALLRWQHPQQGFVNPELIIKVAESTGQILEVDKYVLRRALKDFTALEALGIAPKNISVNLSIMSLEQIDFSDFFKDLHDISF